MPTGAALMTPPVQGCSSLLKRIVARLKTDGMAQVPRRYGDKPSYREVAYEVLFMNKGKPLHVRDILQAAQKQSLLEGPVPEKAWNTLASKLNNDNLGRFRRGSQHLWAFLVQSGRVSGKLSPPAAGEVGHRQPAFRAESRPQECCRCRR